VRAITIVLAATLLAGCAGDPLTTITVTPEKVELTEKGQNESLVANGKSKQGAVSALKAVTWTSSDPAVATVDEKGTVTAVKSGEATITAAAGDVKGSSKVTVLIAGSVEVNPTKLDIAGVDQKAKVTAIVKDDTGKPMPDAVIYWRTSNQNIATVENGEVTSVAAGTVKISAVHAGLSAVVETTIAMPEFAKVVVKPPKLELLVTATEKETEVLEVAATDAKGTVVEGVPFQFTSSNPEIATVTPDGAVTAVKKGKATITITAGDKKATVPVKIDTQ